MYEIEKNMINRESDKLLYNITEQLSEIIRLLSPKDTKSEKTGAEPAKRGRKKQ